MSLRRPAQSVLLPFAFCLLPCLLAGCEIVGVVDQAIPTVVVPRYTGLAGQTVGVMVWADRGMRIEYEFLQLDVANAVQAKLDEAARDKNAKVKELKGTTFPVQPRSIVRFQQDHPEIDGQAITEIAPRLGVKRLIYLEIEEFGTRPDGSIELYRGDAKVTLRVVEIDAAGKAKVAHEENEVAATFPRSAPKEGKPQIGDRRIYVGLVDALGTEVAKRFVPYEQER